MEKLFFSEKTHKKLTWVAQILLPGLGALYFGLAKIWGLPYAVEIDGTILLIDAFLGKILGVSTSNYKKSLENDEQ